MREKCQRVTGINAFELAQPDPLLPHPTVVTPKPTTTSTNPITNLSFSPRRVDILAVASNDSSTEATGGKIVAVQGPASEEYDKAAEEAWGKEMAERMKSRSRKVEPPKVEIWNLASGCTSRMQGYLVANAYPYVERQIITTIYLAHNPVFLAFHPSSKQLAIVCFDSRERNDYVVFAWQPRAVEEETDLVFEDEDISVEKSKREKEREAYRALLARQTQAAAAEAASTSGNATASTTSSSTGLKDEGWQIRTDIRLGEKNSRVSELNGAMFSPCGTRLYAGNHDGRINVWEYPIKRVDNPHAETMNGVDAKEAKEEGDVEMEDRNGAQQEKGDEGEDDEDAPVRRSNENRATDEEQTDTQDGADGAAVEPPANEGESELKTKISQGEEDDVKTSNSTDATSNNEEKEDGEMNGEANIQDVEVAQNGDAVDAEGDVIMEPAGDEPAKPVDSEAATAPDSQTVKPEETPDVTAQDIVPASSSVTQAPTPTVAPVPEAQMLKWLFGQVVNSGCLNCIDIDPRRRYVATGGSEGMVNLCDFKEWIGVASFDSYT